MTAERIAYYTAILDDIGQDDGIVRPTGGGISHGVSIAERCVPWNLAGDEWKELHEEAEWKCLSHKQTALRIAKPVPESANLLRDGWYEMTDMRKQINPSVMQSIWMRLSYRTGPCREL